MNPQEIKIWSDEKMLLSKISLGDEHAFRIIFDRHRRKVYSYALKIIKSVPLAEDILHDVFLKIWKYEDIAEIVNLEIFLRTVTRNHALKLLRRQQLEVRTNYELGKDWKDEHNETEESILLKDTEEILKRAVDLLPPQQKLVYNLCRNEGLKYEEVANRLSISRLTVKTHMQHALRFLRTYVSSHTDVAMLVILMQILNENK